MPLANPIHCSLLASRGHFPHLASHRLEEVAGHVLGVIPDDCRLHRALGDARLLATHRDDFLSEFRRHHT